MLHAYIQKLCNYSHHSFVFRRKNEVVKMSKQSHVCMIAFMMTRLFMFLETSCTYRECKYRLKRTVENRRGGEGRAALSPLLFPAAALIREWQK